MTVTCNDLMNHFSDLGISIIKTDHPPVFTVEEARALRGEIPGAHCKNLFLKDKKGVLWLVVCLEEARVDLKSLPDKIGSARISFGSAELLREVLGVEPGSVTPFALVNDGKLRVKIIIQREMMEYEKQNYHPIVNTSTFTLSPSDLLVFIASCGHEPIIVSM